MLSYTIALDYMLDTNLHIATDAAKYGIIAKLASACGPAGGNPMYRLTGAPSDLRRYLRERYLSDSGLSGYDLEREVELHMGFRHH
jgi:hypothetical protein